MHGHTPGTITALLMAKIVGIVADQEFSQVSIWHIALYINIIPRGIRDGILSAFKFSYSLPYIDSVVPWPKFGIHPVRNEYI